MEKISEANSNNRIIIFIDDLDRCSPKTTLEVFESIKVFLGLEGFIYIVGLSHETILG
jgi:predicted KAP-like P-loop ATPase